MSIFNDLAERSRFYYFKYKGYKTINLDNLEIKISINHFLGDYREVNFFEKNEMDEMRDIIQEVRKYGTFLDVGANIGINSIFASNVSEEVYSIEPHPANSFYLAYNIHLNRSKVELYQCALSDEEGYVEFSGTRGGLLADGSAALSEYDLPEKSGPGDRSQNAFVKSEIGDKLLDKRNIGIPSVIKIDVEGSEGRVIEGIEDTLNSKECRVVYCEIHEGRSKYNRINKILKKHGFSTEVIDSRDYCVTIKAKK